MLATVRDYLNQYPDTGIDLLTPAGLVKIPPRQGRDLLSPRWWEAEIHRIRVECKDPRVRPAGTAHL